MNETDEPSRFPHRLELLHNGEVWVVRGTYRHFWPNGDGHRVDLAGGETARSAIWRAVREVVIR